MLSWAFWADLDHQVSIKDKILRTAYLLLCTRIAVTTIEIAEEIATVMKTAHSVPQPRMMTVPAKDYPDLPTAYLYPLSPHPDLLQSCGEHTGNCAGHKCRRCSHLSLLLSLLCLSQVALVLQMCSL